MTPKHVAIGVGLALALGIGIEVVRAKKTAPPAPSPTPSPSPGDEPLPPPGDKPWPGVPTHHPVMHLADFPPEMVNARVWETSTPGVFFVSLEAPHVMAPFVGFIGQWLPQVAPTHDVFVAEDTEVGVAQPAYFARLDSAPESWSRLDLSPLG